MKRIKYLCLLVLSFVVFSHNVNAAGYEISVTSRTVTLGNSITLNIKGTDLAGKFTIQTSNSGVVSLSKNTVFVDNDTQSITLNTVNSGTSTITIIPTDVTSYSGETITGNQSLTITVNPKPTTNPNTNSGSSSGGGSTSTQTVKSTNSYLASLTVDDFDLNETFDKYSLEYTITLPAETAKIKINAQLDDSRAKVNGTGEKELSVGLNTFEIVVTAENGSKRTYTLKATVEELDPITVKIDNENYTLIRKRKDLPAVSEYWEETEITIDGETIEGYFNKILDYNIVGLKNSQGVIWYYRYKNGKFTKYVEFTFNGTTIEVLDKEVSDTKKTTFIYDNQKITGYQEVKLDLIKNTYALDNNDIAGNQFYLFYGKNLETGKTNLYQYDASEKTIQRYNTLVLDIYKDQSQKYYITLLSVILVLGISLIIFSIVLIQKEKKYKMSYREYEDTKKEQIKEEEKFSFEELKQKEDEIPIKIKPKSKKK